MTAPLTPIDLRPPAGSTVTTSNFYASATLRPWPKLQRAEFQFANNSAFTNNARIVSTDFRNPGSLSVPAGLPRLVQGQGWVRVRSVEQGSMDPSPWSAAQQVTISHPSTALLTYPSSGEFVTWDGGQVTFQWEFSDTSAFDTQNAYRLTVQTDDSDNTYAAIKQVYPSYGTFKALTDNYGDAGSSGGIATIVNTGKVTSGAQSRTVTLPAGARNEIIRWVVETWDNDDQSAGPAPFNPLFVGDLPLVEITAPLVTTDTPNPTITWNYQSLTGHAQERFRVRIYEMATGALLFDSGTQVGTTTSYIPPSQVLRTGVDAQIVLDVFSNIGTMATASVVVTPTWIAPPNPSITIVDDYYFDNGRVDIEWFDSPESSSFITWKVYRRPNENEPWVEIASTTNKFFHDHGAPPVSTVQYSVTQVGTAFGVLVESELFPVNVNLDAKTYLLKVRDEPGLALRLTIVTEDNFEHEYEQEVMEVIGVGRKAEVGTAFGRKGALTIHFRDMGTEGQAAASYRMLQDIKDEGKACYLRIPFRDTLEVHIGNLQVSRIPGVMSELCDINFEYTEITDRAPIFIQ